MKNLFDYRAIRTASLAILGSATFLSSTSALGETVRSNLNISVTILADCMVRAVVVDWISGSRVRTAEQRLSRDMGVLVTTCEGPAIPPVTLKSVGADGRSRPLQAEVRVGMEGMVQAITRAIPVGVNHSVLVRLPRPDGAELAAPSQPDLLLATISF